MNRRFSIITMNENTEEETLDILKGLKKQYEQYHHLNINDDQLNKIVELCVKYLPSRTFPDKAIDVLDLSCVKSSFLNKNQLDNKDIEKVIEEISGLILEEKISIEDIETQLNQSIIGQNKAIHQLCKALNNHKSFNNKPEGIYLLMGSSGIGKSETAKLLAKYLHRPLIRLDMSEYSDNISVTKIIGAAPGYVGYDNQTDLFNEMILHPHSILLLDEIEKAHPQVLHLFLQGFDEGIIKDSHHRIINLSNCIIIMTSNAISHNHQLGFKKQTININQLEEVFSKEFINRIDEIIMYKQLTKDDLIQIAKNNGLTDEQIKEILNHYDIHLGARLLMKKISQYV
jgi:ATP-dependent Clp protease ATP-binding subunit ClpA